MAEALLPPVSREVIQQVWKNLELDENRVKDAVEGIKIWLSTQPHLPKGEDDIRLEHWLIRCKNSMEKMKKTLDLYYTLKTVTPELMCGWDVNEPWFDTIAKYTYGYPMPTLTNSLSRISVYGYFCPDDKDFDFWDNFKLVLIGYELRLLEDYNLKDIFVIDFKNITLGHVTKFTLPLIKKFETCMIGGYNCRLEGVHFINTPHFAEIIVTLVKAVMKSKLVSRIHVYGTDLTEFYKRVPREMLPEEMGGGAGSAKESWVLWQKKIKSCRDWLITRENMKSDETRRPLAKVNSCDLFGFEGSFRKLNMD